MTNNNKRRKKMRTDFKEILFEIKENADTSCYSNPSQGRTSFDLIRTDARVHICTAKESMSVQKFCGI